MTAGWDLSDAWQLLGEITVGDDVYVRLEDDGTNPNRWSRGIYRVSDHDGLERAIDRVIRERLVRVGVAEWEMREHGHVPVRARSVWVETEEGDPDHSFDGVVEPSVVLATRPGRPMCVGWLLSEAITDRKRYDTLAKSLASKTGAAFMPVALPDHVLLPGTYDPVVPSTMVRRVGGTRRRYTVEELDGASELVVAASASSPAAGGHQVAELVTAAEADGLDASDSSDVHARSHDVEELASEDDILARLQQQLCAAGYAGPTELVELVFLVLVSRLLARPLCLIVRAASSAGKSFAVETALKFASPSAAYAVHAMSEKALVFTSERLSHRILVIAEAAGLGPGFMTYGLRELISSGRLRYEYTDFEHGTTRIVETEGPTGLVLTTTGAVDAELSTRMLAVGVPESVDQTRLVLHAIAAGAAGLPRGEADYELFQLLHERLAERDLDVVVPFAPDLVDLIDLRAVRMRRDFSAVLTLVQSHALLHEASRDRDSTGRVLATIADYAAAYRLVAGAIAEGTDRAVPERIRQTVTTVQHLNAISRKPVTINDLAADLGIDASTARRRVMDAVRRGYLDDKGGGAGRPHRLTIGEPLPEDRGVLPTPDEVNASCSRARTTRGGQ